MNWKEFADQYEQILDELVASDFTYTESHEQIIEGRESIKKLRALPLERQEAEISKCKTRQIKEMFNRLKVKN